MPVVAIAGGASPGLGRSIVLAILAGGKWTPAILSRSPKRPLWLRAVDPDGSRALVHAVDYSNEAQLASALQGVHTLISVLLAKDGTQNQKQIALLNAAIKAGCKRFAPSQWANGVRAWDNVSMLRMLFDGVWEACVEKSDQIECARFNNGMFMNYLGIGAFDPKDDPVGEDARLQALKLGGGYLPGDDEVCQGVDKEGDMPDGLGGCFLSLSTATTEIPMRDDGKFPRVTFTTIKDVGRFVTAALDLPKWEANMDIAGDTLRLDEVIKLAESVTGKTMVITKLTRPELEKQMAALKMPQDMLKGLWLELKLSTTKDMFDEALVHPIVNNLCPDVKPTTVREYLENYWPRKVT